MNQPRTARVRVSVLVLTAVLAILSPQVGAQESLGDLVSRSGFDWMIGKWVAETDDGQRLLTTYKWELDKHIITVQFKMGDYEFRGMIMYLATEQKVVQIGADNRGGTSKAEWNAEGDKAVSITTGTGAYGEVQKFGISHAKADANTMTVEVYPVESTGELADEPWATLKYKRQ
ncbi:MAG: hypothetical protein JSU70_00960 [Phycisphaerales bacterium]|nr:MAG: hypothetical protein JSU70_00960 [Phycisphaerales bacterium]